MLEHLLTQIDLPYRYAIAASFVTCLAIQEVFSPWLSRTVTSSYVQLTAVRQVEWDNRIMSIAHALTATYLSLYAFFGDEGLTPDVVRYNSHTVLLSSAILLGYALADLLETCMRPRALWTTDMVFHHLICIGIPCVYFTYRCAPYYGNIGWMTEISSPFLHIRRLLMMSGSKKTSQAYKINGMLFLLTFFVFRIAVIPWFWHNWLFRLTVNPDYYLPENAVALNSSMAEALIMNVLNCYWFVKLCIVTWRHLYVSKEHDD